MHGFARFLPLSSREPADESHVTTDRRAALAEVVDRAADVLALVPDPESHAAAFVAEAGLLEESRAIVTGEPVPRVRALAGAVRGGRRRSIRDLSGGVRALLALARDVDRDAGLDPLIAGAAAFAASAHAPADRRAVIRGRTVRASDADWSFGHGPVLTGTATEIAAFLLGVSDTPPQPLRPRG